MTLTRTLEICNQRGLHARASAKFVKTASAFDADIRVSRVDSHDGARVDARSIMGLLMLGAAIGSSITLEAEGTEAEAALAALTTLVQNRFDEEA